MTSFMIHSAANVKSVMVDARDRHHSAHAHKALVDNVVKVEYNVHVTCFGCVLNVVSRTDRSLHLHQVRSRTNL